ncbi:hypothetical protein [Actinokineospora enzanensis]|uniref:hypothetical protein n=1 Tax=Actinokineospora enzanensis TaxID=155975 RepID=UPI00035D74D4|nr:hypothetical protein [Actinokineospora enzanensis]
MTGLDRATARYLKAKAELDAATAVVAEEIVVELRRGTPPTDVAERSPYSPAYVRRIAREHGIAPAPPGPKPKG